MSKNFIDPKAHSREEVIERERKNQQRASENRDRIAKEKAQERSDIEKAKSLNERRPNGNSANNDFQRLFADAGFAEPEQDKNNVITAAENSEGTGVASNITEQRIIEQQVDDEGQGYEPDFEDEEIEENYENETFEPVEEENQKLLVEPALLAKSIEGLVNGNLPVEKEVNREYSPVEEFQAIEEKRADEEVNVNTKNPEPVVNVNAETPEPVVKVDDNEENEAQVNIEEKDTGITVPETPKEQDEGIDNKKEESTETRAPEEEKIEEKQKKEEVKKPKKSRIDLKEGAKQVARVGAALALAFAVPGIGFILGAALYIATANYGKKKDDDRDESNDDVKEAINLLKGSDDEQQQNYKQRQNVLNSEEVAKLSGELKDLNLDEINLEEVGKEHKFNSNSNTTVAKESASKGRE